MNRNEHDELPEVPGGSSSLMPAEKWLVSALQFLGGIALGALALLTVADALLRSFANRPILGGNDMVQVLLVLVVAASIPLCIHAGRAIAIEMILERLPAGPRVVITKMSDLLCATVLAVLSWRCAINASQAALFGETTMLLQIPFGPFYWCLAVSFALSALLFALKFAGWRLAQ